MMESPTTSQGLLQQLSDAHESAQTALHAAYREEIKRLRLELDVLRRHFESHVVSKTTGDIDIMIEQRLQTTNASAADTNDEARRCSEKKVTMDMQGSVLEMPDALSTNSRASVDKEERSAGMQTEPTYLLPRELTKGATTRSSMNGEPKLRQSWTDHPEQEKADWDLQTIDIVMLPNCTGSESSRSIRVMSTAVQKSLSCSDRWVAQPGANWRLVWDVIGALLIGYDTIAIPFGLSFQPGSSIFLTTMDWTTMFFWTLDMIFTFFVGYMHKGQVVQSPYLIARRYLMTWFILDAIVVAGDWFNNVGNASSESGSMSGIGKMIRSLRAIRILRLLRLLKLRRMMAEVQDHINSEYTYLLLNLTKLLLFIVFLNHGIACLWYWLGRQGYANGDPSWVEANKIMSRDLGYKYTTSMHWTLTQFTPASMEVFPQNTEERSMSVIVLMFALVAFGSFVGSISASMTALRTMNADTNKQFWMLRRFLKQQSVPKHVSRRILKYLEYVVELKQGKVQQSNIKILALLSEQLREELLCELTRPYLQEYRLFKFMRCFPHMEVTFRRLCTFAFKQQMIAAGDVLFYTGDEASHTYRVNNGHLLYQTEGKDLKPPIQEMEWLSEAAIWVPWKHMGRLNALAEAELLAADVKIFASECCKSLSTWRVMSSFAKIFLAALGSCSSPITDVIRDEKFHSTLQEGCNNGRDSIMRLLTESGHLTLETKPSTPGHILNSLNPIRRQVT